ncbi:MULTISPECIES: glycoside hydrolase family 31 protein [unclassified Schaalia]|uniref:glycoside hydrolase family 31 protein n=1 Tax=unclassified Schaalia TaxID=2691889 RepID=UPI001E4AB672|nr:MULTISPECIES: TIM-barrel domain-containing protein [unclassified Schaalia]MCD4550061.1 family 31 glucosidase [Schaalia sp. lx-260]MCD4557872.1 family 31 glucosidase [Schaalia sp. lx-100]
MLDVTVIPTGFEARHEHQVLRVETWGPDAVRVRISRHTLDRPDYGALIETPEAVQAEVEVSDTRIRMRAGELGVNLVLDPGAGNPRTMLTFLRNDKVILTETPEHFWWPGAHGIYPVHGGAEVHQVFASDPEERFYGLGQHSHGHLNHKGLVMDLIQRNGEVSIPFVLSDRGYGFLWNNPAVGRVEFSADSTRWVGQGTEIIDYWLCLAPTPRDILARYADVVGHAPVLPQWATGFWQSRLRYMSQEELLEVARRYRDLDLPLSVIVTDFIHWPAMGDFRFDENEYPDPAAMMRELDDMGTKLMVSVWPTVSPLSENYEEMRSRGFLVGTENGVEFHQKFKDKGMPTAMPVAFYDATNPQARAYVWNKIKQNYHDLGVRVFWLDACEPELNPGHPGNLSYHAGPGLAVNNTYPRDNAKGFYDGMQEAGTPETVLLCRSAWAGQARYGAAVWSGDIAPTWEALRTQVTAGQSIAISGIPWWTSDIGGFHGGDPTDPAYQELFIRWFQFGTFCPLFRLHGHREPREAEGAVSPGGPNEIWSYGEEAFTIAADYIRLREKIRPYINQLMEIAATDGIPPMRPLFLEYPHDLQAWNTEHEFMLGPDLLIRPVTEAGVTHTQVYLPQGATWRELATGQTYTGGCTVEVDTPIHTIPVFIREGADLPL